MRLRHPFLHRFSSMAKRLLVIEMARYYYEEGADEIVFYDITASSDRRDIMIDEVRRVASQIFISLSVGGGIRTLEDMRAVLLAGAEKVSVNSAAVLNPRIIADGARIFGSLCPGPDRRRVCTGCGA